MELQETIDIKYEQIEGQKQKLSEDHYMNPEQEDELEELIALAIKFGELCAQRDLASPEGFVLVRKELPEEIAESMALERVEKPVTETDPTWIKISEDAYKGRIQSKKWELWRDYKAMIEAQEQSHELD